MKTIEEKVIVYVAKDGSKFKDRGQAIMYEKGLPYSDYYVKLTHTKEFCVTENHLKLVNRTYIDWAFHKDSYNGGYFYQDIKRPYGNSSWIEDIGEIIGLEPECFDKEDPNDKWYSDSQIFELVKLHIDMRIVMQILCQNLSINIGKYVRTSYDIDWKLS
jgi:hypothetical protein